MTHIRQLAWRPGTLATRRTSLLLTGCAGCGNAAPAFRAAPGWRPRYNKEQVLAKPEWGTKRICPSCGTRYYDLLREQVICPKCSTPYDPEAFLRARRSRPAAPVEREPVTAGDDADTDNELETEELETAEDEEEAAPLAEGDEEEDEEILEDASELGEDEDDMAEVIDNVEEEEP
jgi:uncharacterized protein (TIGR02300 family)